MPTQNLVQFEVPGRPVGWQRAGYNSRTGVRYTRQRDRQWREKVAWFARAAWPRPPAVGAMSLTVAFLYPMKRGRGRYCASSGPPREAPGGRTPSFKIEYVTGPPDLDNLVKGVADALRGIVFQDDSQIAWLQASKERHSDLDAPRTIIVVQLLS